MKHHHSDSNRLGVPAILAAIFLLASLAPQPANAAATASDTACNDTGANGTTGGSGFGAWVTTLGSTGGTYTGGDTTINGNGCGTAWGSYTGTATTTATSQSRPFTGADGQTTLQPGQQLVADLHNGGVATGGSEGLTLWNADNNLVWELHYDGNDAWYVVDNSGTTKQATIPYLGSGGRVTFTLASATSYSFTVKVPGTGTQTTYGPFTGTLASPTGGAGITQMRFYTFAIGSNNNLQFNNLGVSCPDTLKITNSPTAQTNCAGTTAAFTVGGISGDSVTYQWQRNGTNLSNGATGSGATYGGATTATLTIANVQSGDAAATANGYSCVVEDACGDLAFSTTNALTVLTNPAGVTLNHTTDTICAGSTESATATPSGSATGGDWTSSGTGGFSSTNTDSTVYTPSPADITAGTVTLTFTATGPASPCGPATAQDVVTISPASAGGTATAAPADLLAGSSTTITLSGSTGTIQWQASPDDMTFTNIPGATNAAYPTPALANTTYYRAVVTSGACSSSASSVAAVTVGVPPVITAEPTNTTVCSGSPAAFAVTASGPPSSYAWFDHANAGWGSAWTLAESGGTIFLNSSTENNNSAPNCNSFSGYGDINTSSGNAWGLYGPEQATRTFPAALTNGQVFQVDMDNGFVNDGLSVGFSLHNSSNAFLFTFYFPGGGTNYVYSDGTGTHTTSVGYTINGLRVAVVVGTGSPAGYSLLITPCGGGTVEYPGVFSTTGTPDIVLLYNNNTNEDSSAYNLYFNRMFAGLAYDDADNYGADWSGVDAGDASPIGSATNASYSTSAGTNGELYYAVAYNSFGAAASSVAGLTMVPPETTTPVISPSSSVAAGGGLVTISETLSRGLAPFSYQWQSNGVDIGTATVSSAATNALVLSPAGFAAGSYNYSVVVTNCSGASTSAPVTLTVIAPGPPVVFQNTTPSAVTTYTGGTAMFQAAFTSLPPVLYQWEFTTNHINYGNVPGATNTTLMLGGVQLTNAGYYSLWASNSVTGGYTVSSGDAQLVVLPGSPPAIAVITNTLGLAVAVNSGNGTYTITSTVPAWKFAGSIGGALNINNVDYNSGVDNLGGYAEILFSYTNVTSQTAAIRLYDDQPVILFSDTALAATPNADFSFPNLTTFPGGLIFDGFTGLWGNYTFSTNDLESPWLYFDTNFNSFIISAATNYMIASNSLSGGEISCGINSGVPTLPAGFTHLAVLVIENGINRTYDTWGNALTTLSGKVRPANDAAVELDKLGYWTDNGATYYYNFVGSYLSTLQTISAEFSGKGFPLGYVQLDSWWYPKGAADTWEGDPINNRGGIYTYVADPTLFPTGLASFQQQLGGLPLITHARWIDPASPYQSEYAMSADVSVDPNYWAGIMGYIQNSGVVTYEQDWMNQMAAPEMNLTNPPAFMNDMAAAAATNGLNMQYCMPTPKIYLQGSLYNNLLTMRVCPDIFQRSHWDEFLYDSRLVSAVGAYPWTDVEYTGDLMDVLIGTLSAGPVGLGDAIGTVNAASLAKVARPDSVIVKPDAPLLPVDQTYLNDAQGNGLPMVASTYTDFDGLRAYYVFSYARSSTSTAASFTPASLGASNNVYVYNYFAQTGNVMNASSAYHFTTTVATAGAGASFFVVAPVGPSGIALVGDTNKYVTLGKKRISALADTGVLHATVVFAAGESSVTLSGYAPSAPYLSINNGPVVAASYNPASQWFTLSVPSDGFGSAEVALSLNSSSLPQALKIVPAGGGQYELTWGGPGTLLEATNLNGPWTTNAAAVSPFPVSPTGSNMFFWLVP
jgi:hypothetical protein